MARKDTRSLVDALLFGTTMCVGLALMPAGQAFATEVDIANVTASSEIPPNFTRFDDFLIDGSGLNAVGEHGTSPDTSMWLSTGDGFGGADLDPFVIFDLGAVYEVNSLRVWNYNESGTLSRRGVNAVSVQYGTTNALGSTIAGITNFTQAPGAAGYTGELFTPATFNARYVKFDIDSNHGGDNNFYGLSEVKFDGRLTNVINTVSIEDFSSQLSVFGDRLAVKTINGLGLNDAAGTHGNDAGTMWLTDGPFQGDEGNDVLPSFITYDLGDNYDLEALHVWNYNEAAAGNTDRGAKDVEISIATSEGGPFVSLGNFVFDRADGTTTYEGQLISLADLGLADNVRLIKFDITSNYGDTDNVVGLSEVRFSGTVVPEPSSLALIGLGGLLIARRRRR